MTDGLSPVTFQLFAHVSCLFLRQGDRGDFVVDGVAIGSKGDPGVRGLPGIDVSWPVSWFISLSICGWSRSGQSTAMLVCLHVLVWL